MFSFFKHFIRQKPKVKLISAEIPADIKAMGDLYPVIHTVVENLSTGEIKQLSIGENKLRIGQAMVINRDKEVWVHLGNDYFKNIVKL
jgi:hypothetical protein